MNIYTCACALALLVTGVTSNVWLFGPEHKMNSFFQEQKARVEKALASSYENVVQMKNKVNNYVEEQHRKISSDINQYMENVKETSRNALESWSYLPTDDPESKIDNPEAVLTVPSIISRHGYPCETHTVVSKGYILNVHRIPNAKRGQGVSSKTVYLQHGFLASSADWIINGPEKGLAYVLANAGYDVWMGNNRGNRYSREHASLKTDSKPYWNFSWHDIAEYDVPAIIDYILELKGNNTQITYIGHSMGTTILFAMLTLRPEYNTILSAGFALAPVVFMSDVKSPLKSLAPITINLAYMEMLYGSHEFIPKQSALGRYTASCQVGSMDFTVCKNTIFYICGHDEKQFNKTLFPVFLNHLGTGTSWKTVVHFAQEVVAGGKFQQFDYGTYHNMKVYGREAPPEYDLSKVTLPITLFWAENDLLSSEKDVMKLYEKLPATKQMYKVPFAQFNHLDYLWAIDAPTLINEKLLEYLHKVYEDKKEFFFDLRFGK